MAQTAREQITAVAAEYGWESTIEYMFESVVYVKGTERITVRYTRRGSVSWVYFDLRTAASVYTNVVRGKREAIISALRERGLR